MGASVYFVALKTKPLTDTLSRLLQLIMLIQFFTNETAA